jgi:altronate hydrolase
LATARRVPAGHKVALRPHAAGDAVRRYGQIIGFATEAIAPGEWVHTHNLSMGDFARDYAWGVDAKPTESWPSPRPSWASAAPTGARRRATTSASSPR